MQYLRRAVKYVLYFALIFIVIVGLLWVLTLRQQGIALKDTLQPGSLPKLIIFFVAVGAIYPYLNFRTRKLYFNGDFAANRDMIVGVFTDLGYEIIEEKEGSLAFRLSNKGMRLSRLYEDRIDLKVSDNPLEITGYRRDVDRIMRSLNYKIQEIEQSKEE